MFVLCLIKKVSLLAVLQGERSSNWPDYLKCSFSGLNLSYPRSHRKGTDANLHSPSGLGKWFLHCERSGISIRLDEQSLWKMDLSHIPCLQLCSPTSSYLEWARSVPWISWKARRRYVAREINSVFGLYYEAWDDDVMWALPSLLPYFPQVLFYVLQ